MNLFTSTIYVGEPVSKFTFKSLSYIYVVHIY